jgi:hypothetical protein
MVLKGDGSTTFLNSNIELATWRALSTRNQAEIVIDVDGTN